KAQLSSFVLVESIQLFISFSPSHQIKEAVSFHGKLKLSLKMNRLASAFLTGKSRMTCRISADTIIRIFILLPISGIACLAIHEYQGRLGIRPHHPVTSLRIL